MRGTGRHCQSIVDVVAQTEHLSDHRSPFTPVCNAILTDDDAQQDYDSYNDDDPHLHVLPPHLLSYSVGSSSESLSAHGQVV